MKYFKVRFCDEGGDNVRGNAYVYGFNRELLPGDVVELPSSRPNQDNPHGVVVGEVDKSELEESRTYKEIVKVVKYHG